MSVGYRIVSAGIGAAFVLIAETDEGGEMGREGQIALVIIFIAVVDELRGGRINFSVRLAVVEQRLAAGAVSVSAGDRDGWP